MTEKNYVVNVKTKLGTIVTVRSDSADELKSRINEAITSQLSDFVLALEEAINGAQPSPAAVTNHAVATVNQVFGTPAAAPAPVAAPAPAQANPSGAPFCAHGAMNYVDGTKQGKSWKAWMCNAERGATDKCPPQWIK